MLSLAPLTSDLPSPQVVKCCDRASLHVMSVGMMELSCLDIFQMIVMIVRAVCMHVHCFGVNAQEV